MTKTYQKYKTRITILTCFILLSWVGLCFRLFQVQILNGSEYQLKLIRQSHKKHILHANRGNIFDRNNKPLTRNIIHYTLSVNPNNVTEGIAIASAISDRTGEPMDKYLKKINSKSSFEYLERNLQRETLGLLTNSSFSGLNIKRNYRRYYPHSSIGAQVLGYTNYDDEGISGIEKDFNTYLKGTSGWVQKTKGLSGKIQHRSGMPYLEPRHGNNIQLTLDLEYQSILEQELLKRKSETNAVSATGLIMNPQSGEILAIASVPGFDNNNFSNAPPEFHKIRAITDQFEPGSTFKVVSAIAALKNKDVSLNDEFNCENGEYQYHDIQVTDHIEHEILTVPQIIQHSSNIGIVKMVERIGPKKLFTTCRDLGFGSKTGIKLQGEITGKLHSHMDWSTVSLGQIAMGHEVGVTAIQIATAYCAIANGGYLVRPRLIKHIVDDKNKIIFSEEPSVYRRICDSKTMSSIRLMLADVITSGTGEKANIPGWKVAGKTGTAQKWKDGKYSNEQFISNFVGFFPYDNPSILVFVMLDEPEQPYHWGSEGAAVAFKRIASRVINMDSQIKPPKKIDYTLVQNNEIQDFKVNSENDYHKKSFIKPLSLSTSKLFKHQTEVPEIRGYSMRKAMKTLRDHNLKFKIKGSGKVEWQSPRPGEVVNKGTVCVIGLK